jgi:cobalt-zinc-cadmium efflux system outer membrane protein
MQVFGWIVGVLFLFLAGFTGMAPFSFADDLDTRLTQTVSVADLIAYAKLKNPSIREVREEWRGVIEEYRFMTGYPDPELNVTYYPSPLETRLGPQDWTASFSQKIPFPGKLSKAGEVVKANAQIAQIKLDKMVREVIAGVRESYHELLYIRKAGEVAAQNLKLLRHLRKVSETAYARDRAVLMDMVKAQSQLGQLRYDALLLEELEMTEKTTLNGLLNRAPDAKIGRLLHEPYRPVVFKLKKLYQLAEANREEVRIAQMRVKKAGAEVELAEYENLPDFKVGVFYSSIGDPDVPQRPSGSGRDVLGVQIGLSIPLWFEKNRGRKGRALAGIEKAKSAKTAFVNDTRTRVHYLFFRLENSRRLVELYEKDLLPQAIQSMEIAETWYREGEATFSDFVETQAVFYNFQLSLIRARADYGKYLARLEQIVGQTVTKNNSGLADNAREEGK